jgi:cell division protein FtsW
MFFVTVLLIVAGLVMVFSASAIVAQEKFHSPYTFVGKQAIWALAGFLVLVLLMNIKYQIYNSPGFVFSALGVTVFLLVLVYFFRDSHKTHRWIRFGDFFSLQPSEIAKLVMVLFLAWFLHTRLDRMRDWRHTLLLAVSVPVLLIVLIVGQPDLGTAMVLGGVTAMMLLLAGMNWKPLAIGLAVALPPLIALLILVPWRLRRMLVFFHPNCDSKEAGGAAYHVCQSLIAVGAGGVTGRGYMEGVQKLFYLPEGHTDFIFANIAEELGFIGTISLLLLFVAFGVRGMRTVFRCKDNFGKLMAFGITTTIVLQAFFNISVVLSLVPTKGIPLPLISFGGTSLFCTLASIGILLNISRTVD